MKLYTQTSRKDSKIYTDSHDREKIRLSQQDCMDHLNLKFTPINSKRQLNIIANCITDRFTQATFDPNETLANKLRKSIQIINQNQEYDCIQLKVCLSDKSSQNVNSLPQSVKNWAKLNITDSYLNGTITIYKKKQITLSQLVRHFKSDVPILSIFDYKPYQRPQSITNLHESPEFLVVNQSGFDFEQLKWFINQLQFLQSWIEISLSQTIPMNLVKIVPRRQNRVKNEIYILAMGCSKPVDSKWFQNKELYDSHDEDDFLHKYDSNLVRSLKPTRSSRLRHSPLRRRYGTKELFADAEIYLPSRPWKRDSFD